MSFQHQHDTIDADTLRALIEKKCPGILRDYESLGMLSDMSRKRLVKIAVGGLVDRSGL